MTIHADPLGVFIASARAFPMLEPDAEQSLARRFREYGDQSASHEMAECHLKLVIKVAAKFVGYGVPLADLIQEGNVGMMEALKRFKPERGFRFSTYSKWWIKAKIFEYVLNTHSAVRISPTSANKTLFFALKKLKRRLGITEEGDLKPEHVEKIAHWVNVPTEKVVEINRRLSQTDASLNVMREDRRGNEICEWIDTLEDDTALDQETLLIETEENEKRLEAMINALDVLNDREKRVFEARRLAESPLTLEVLGNDLGISRERVRQIEVRAFNKVQKRTRELYGKHTTTSPERKLVDA
jgi:RNA polymerase sigma-32 factor